MNINKTIFLFIFLSAIISNSKTIDEKINEDINKINEVEKQIKYDKFEDAKNSIHIETGKKVSLVFNKDIDNPTSYVVFSNGKPDSVRIVNNATLSSRAEVITSLHNHDFSNLIYVINNKKLVGTADNVNAVSLIGKYIYFKNSENALLTAKNYPTSMGFRARELGILDNAGTIEKDVYMTLKNGSIINRSSGLHNDLIAHFEENGNYKNEGKVNGRIVVLSMLSFKFVNSGIINDVKYGLPFLIGTEGNFKGKYLNYGKEILFLNTSTGVIKKDKMFVDSGVGIMNFQNFGNIESNVYITAIKGSVDNNKEIIGDVYLTNYYFSKIDSWKKIRNEDTVLNVNLQNGKVEGNLILKRKGLKETIVTIKSMDNITGMLDSTEGDNDILRLIGSGEVKSKDKFKDFEKIHLQNSDWTFSDEEYKVNNEILVEASKLSIKKGDLKTKKFTNNERSTINILKDSNIEVEDKFVNKGLISFLNSKDNTSNLSIKGNYVGENSKLLMRTYIDKNESDILKLDGSASGSTGVEISNPNSTLNKRMKNKLKLIETKSSTKDAFTLLNPEHGIYRYRLSLENNNWYLSQEYNKPFLGLILNSIDKLRNESNLTYYDHNKLNNGRNEKLWTKIKNISSKNILSDNINIDSNITNIFIGYDILEKKEYKYGVFGNLLFDRVSSGKEKKSGKTGAFGLGLYGTWHNKHFYADSWLNYMYSQNSADRLNYELHSLKASIEVGTRGDMYIGKNRLACNLYEQLIFSYVSNPNIEDVNNLNNVNIKSRLGTNLTLFTNHKNINPYIEFNWSYDTRLVGVRVEKEEYLYNNNKNTFELKWGLREMNVNDRLSMWANMVHRFNEAGYRANGVEAGMVYKMI
ncbi:autotransporter domain-containing protein [Streptobacillus moniliformis]|uniref:autotransporter domain-containing protein n=4 Tax=Streptobacillus moniliformis TaxID=34105 RepID=UPI0007E4229F|nr:autotransporter domain-containing protein [Streptobacillus moniliformis]